MSTQNGRLLNWLETHPEGITRLEAMRDLGIMNLWARCAEIEKLGYLLHREDGVEVKDRFGNKCRVTRYKLIGQYKMSEDSMEITTTRFPIGPSPLEGGLMAMEG